MRDVRKKSPNIKIVPRVIFDHWTSPHFLQVFEDQNLADKVGYLIAKTIIDNKFDGLVLGVNFINILRAVFTRTDPISVKRY